MASIKIKKPIILQPPERLDAMGGKSFQRQVVAIIPENHNLWVIDMAHVEFVDSSGLFELVAGLRAARQQGCRLVVCNLQKTVRLIFEITQLDQVFEIFDSYEVFLQTLMQNEDAPLLYASLAA
jgi:anti-sigma B factor antagonist